MEKGGGESKREGDPDLHAPCLCLCCPLFGVCVVSLLCSRYCLGVMPLGPNAAHSTKRPRQIANAAMIISRPNSFVDEVVRLRVTSLLAFTCFFFGRILSLGQDIAEAVTVSDLVAPEHLEIQTENSQTVADR